MSIYHVTEERKMRDKRGKGTGADYKPWIYVREIKSDGTSSEPIDWTNGRTCQLLSQGEKYLWYYLRWDDSVKNIYEQYPLNLDATNSIAFNSGIKPMLNGKKHMTTDFYVEYQDIDTKINRKKVNIKNIITNEIVSLPYSLIIQELKRPTESVLLPCNTKQTGIALPRSAPMLFVNNPA